MGRGMRIAETVLVTAIGFVAGMHIGGYLASPVESIVVRDVDHDGKEDVIVMRRQKKTVFLQQDDGSYKEAREVYGGLAERIYDEASRKSLQN